jgi:hypothetical protein
VVLVVPVADARAGEVSGVVRFAGAAPAAGGRIPATKDRRVCGDDVPDESLLVADGRVANVIVALRGAALAPLPPARAVLDQQRCRFTPRVQVAPLGSTLDVVNGDPLLHSVHAWAGRMTRFSLPMPTQGMRTPAKLDRPGLLAIRCDIHGWMSAWLLVAEGPAVVTGADGAFTLRDLPPGSYTVTAWHERLGEQAAEVTVPPKGAARLEIAYRP